MFEDGAQQRDNPTFDDDVTPCLWLPRLRQPWLFIRLVSLAFEYLAQENLQVDPHQCQHHHEAKLSILTGTSRQKVANRWGHHAINDFARFHAL